MATETQKLTPLKFLPDVQELPWGTVEYALADLGFIDSLASEGWLSGNTLSDIMQTYLERVVGETAFDWYGTQFPVLVKHLKVKGRTSLHVNPDDETAADRYDAFGKTALWYVESAGPDARLLMGFKRAVSASEFYEACQAGTVDGLLHSVRPKAGESYLITPGLVHAAQDVQLLEVAECSELCFRLHDWGAQDRELHLEEAFDLIDLGPWKRQPVLPEGIRALTPQFTVGEIDLKEPLRSHAGLDETFLIFCCVAGAAAVEAGGKLYHCKAGELVLVPAECAEFTLLPTATLTRVLEVRMDPRPTEEFPEDGSTDR